MAFIKALIFDLDNTLFDRDEVARKVLSEMGCETHLEAVMRADAGGMSDRLEFAKRVVSIAGLQQSPEEFWVEFRERVASCTPYSSEVRSMLLRLAPEYRLAVLSNGGSANQRVKVKNLGIEGLLNALVISGDHSFAKPDAEAFHYTCKLLGCSSVNTLMVGNDYDTDILGATTAGLQALWVGQVSGKTSIPHVSQIEEWLSTQDLNSAS